MSRAHEVRFSRPREKFPPSVEPRNPLELVDRHGSSAKLIMTACGLEDVARAPCKEAGASGEWNPEGPHADAECDILSLMYAQGVFTSAWRRAYACDTRAVHDTLESKPRQALSASLSIVDGVAIVVAMQLTHLGRPHVLCRDFI